MWSIAVVTFQDPPRTVIICQVGSSYSKFRLYIFIYYSIQSSLIPTHSLTSYKLWAVTNAKALNKQYSWTTSNFSEGVKWAWCLWTFWCAFGVSSLWGACLQALSRLSWELGTWPQLARVQRPVTRVLSFSLSNNFIHNDQGVIRINVWMVISVLLSTILLQ